MKRERGSILLEMVMYTPVLLLMMLGMIEIARVTYTYYTLQKMLVTVARYVGTGQGVNFCDDADATVTAAKNYALTGTTDASADPIIGNLTIDQIQVRIERFTAANADIGQCACDAAGCDTTNGGQAPDYIVVSIPEGYSIQLVIPQLPVDPILLKPRIRLPYQGT